jgi:hypothetical protein
VSVTALKEWSAAVHAMLDGRQTVLLRKGGIHEKRFEVNVNGAGGFVFFPTVAHGHVERVRPEHRAFLEDAGPDSTEEQVILRAGARVVAAVAVNRPEGLADLEDTHIWTAESVHADRLDFRPKHRLTVLVVQARPLAEALTLRREPSYAGCKSWLELPVAPVWSEPVHDDATLAAVTDRVRASVG